MSETLREEFNQWVRDGRSSALESHHRCFVEDMISRMSIQPRDRILEIGCGEGWASRELASLAPEGMVVGLDVSDEMIHKARAQSAGYENLLLIWGEAESIPWQEKFFSKAICVEAFYYFESPEKDLAEIYRVLSPGGSLSVLNHLSLENEISLQWLSEMKVPVHLRSAEEYQKLFEVCGFQEYSFRMIPDRTPENDAPYYGRLADPAERHRFRELGALLMTARRPEE
jgi:ubiquinone/menaquinone biosynthesis C-methylase UbiE